MDKKNTNISEVSEKELKKAQRVARLLSALPSEKFLSVIETHEQLMKWTLKRKDNDWVSKCFVARVAGGDPLLPLLKAKEIDRWLYDFLWNSANFYFSLWDLIQFSIDQIREYFVDIVKIDFPFNSALELFLDIVEIQEKNEYSVWLKPYHKVSKPDLLAAATTTRKSVWCKNAGGLDPKEKAKLDQFLASYPKNELLKFVWGICLHHSKSNSQIKEKVETVMRAVAKTADLHAVACRKRESVTFTPYRSFEIHKGVIRYGNQYGGTYS